MEHFSDRLRYARTVRQLSQAELGRAAGLSQGAISSYETGTRKNTTGLIQLAQALQVNPAWLITGTGTMEFDADPVTDHGAATRLQDVQRVPVSVTWPFTTIKPSEYWALPEAKRRVIEHTVAALIAAMHQESDKA